MTFRLAPIFITITFLLAESASAESVLAERTTALRRHPGEKAKVVYRLRAGRHAKVVGRRGRWLKVAVGGLVGWVTRTSVKRRPPPRRRRRRWSDRTPKRPPDRTKREFERQGRAGSVRASLESGKDGQLVATVIADSSWAFARPTTRSRRVFAVREGDELAVAGQVDGGRWALIESAGGQSGWVLTAALTDHPPEPGAPAARAAAEASKSIAATAAPPRADTGASAAEVTTLAAAAEPGMTVKSGAEIGPGWLSRDFSSDGTAGLANYHVAATAAIARTGGELRYRGPLAGRVSFGIDAHYQVGRSSPGIHYQSGSSGAEGNIAFSTHELDAGASAGVRLIGSSPAELVARAGYRYDVFRPDKIGNVALLPRERLAGPVAGLGVGALPLSDELTAQVHVDVLIHGTRTQTANLEDGETARVQAARVTAAARYAIAPSWRASARFCYGWVRTRWSGPSQRLDNVSGANRVDTEKILLAGLTRLF